MKIISTPDSTIHFAVHNEQHRETILFLHGVGLDHTEWSYLLPLLNDYRLITIDLRWHGESSGEFYWTDEENWNALFSDIITLLKSLKIEQFHLISHGIGAQLAVELIYKGICTPLTNTIISTPFYYPEEVAKKGMEYRENFIKGMSGRELGTWMIPQIMNTKDPNKHELVKAAYEKSPIDLHMDIFRLHANAVSLEKLMKIVVPTLLINGELDVNYPPELTNLSMKYLPNGHAEVVQQASNMVHLDQPELTANIINEFIGSRINHKKQRRTAQNLPYLELLYKELEKTKLLVRIDFLTVFEMRINGKVIEGKWNQRKAKELVAYLAFHSKSRKETVCAALWPEANQDSAQNMLRVSTHHVRSLLRTAGFDDLILTDSHYIWLNEEKIEIRCDVIEAIEKNRTQPLPEQTFTDITADWTLPIQYQLG